MKYIYDEPSNHINSFKNIHKIYNVYVVVPSSQVQSQEEALFYLQLKAQL